MRVAAALLQRRDGRVLLGCRPLHKDHGGLWEFPGGKLEPGEDWAQALARELDEELGVRPGPAPCWMCLHRPGMELRLYRPRYWHGSPQAREGQPLAWVRPLQLEWMAQAGLLAPADRLLAESLTRPLVAITPEDFLHRPGLQRRLPDLARRGVRRLLLRPGRVPGRRALAGLPAWLQACRALGMEPVMHERLYRHWPGKRRLAAGCTVHLSQASLMRADLPPDRPFSVSCHDAASLARAEQAGARFALLSPVQATASHPQRSPLGWAGLQALLETVQLPVYALGGLGPAQGARARAHGAVGAAGIRGFWFASA